jgi:hypothetical protein
MLGKKEHSICLGSFHAVYIVALNDEDVCFRTLVHLELKNILLT